MTLKCLAISILGASPLNIAKATTIQQLDGIAWGRCIKGTRLSYPIEYFFEGSEAIASSSERALVIQPEWDSWNIEERKIASMIVLLIQSVLYPAYPLVI